MTKYSTCSKSHASSHSKCDTATHTSCNYRDYHDYDYKGLPFRRHQYPFSGHRKHNSCGRCNSHGGCDCYTKLALEYTHLYFNAFPKAQRCRYSRFNNDSRCDIGNPCANGRANPCNPKYGPNDCETGCCHYHHE